MHSLHKMQVHGGQWFQREQLASSGTWGEDCVVDVVRMKGVVKPYIWDTSYICDTCYMLLATPVTKESVWSDDCWIAPTSLGVWETSAIKHQPKTKSKINFKNLSYFKLELFKL